MNSTTAAESPRGYRRVVNSGNALSMSTPADVERRLDEYATWRNQPDMIYPSGASVFARIHEMQENAGVRAQGIKPDILVYNGEAVMCRPDGGMARKAEVLGELMETEQRCIAIHDLVRYLPDDLQRVFLATYVGPPREVPRRERDAAERLQISLTKYQKLKYGLLNWFRGVHFRSAAIRGP